MAYDLIASWFFSTPWAILPERLAVMAELLHFRVAGGRLTADEIRERIGAVDAANRRAMQPTGIVAVLPLYGVIAQRMDLITESSGGTSTNAFTRQFRGALADPQVGAIVIDVDSPGGAVFGVDELASEIYRARGRKPIIAIANSLAASAAYWIATAADELIIMPGGEVGGIGVYAAHEDLSKAMEQDGVGVTLIAAGKYKIENSPYGPLSNEARAHVQERVDEYFGMFVKAVARARGVAPAQVRDGFGEGRVVGARQAVDLGMADRVGTLDDAIVRAGFTQRKRAANARDLRQRRLRLHDLRAVPTNGALGGRGSDERPPR